MKKQIVAAILSLFTLPALALETASLIRPPGRTVQVYNWYSFRRKEANNFVQQGELRWNMADPEFHTDRFDWIVDLGPMADCTEVGKPYKAFLMCPHPMYWVHMFKNEYMAQVYSSVGNRKVNINVGHCYYIQSQSWLGSMAALFRVSDFVPKNRVDLDQIRVIYDVSPEGVMNASNMNNCE